MPTVLASPIRPLCALALAAGLAHSAPGQTRATHHQSADTNSSANTSTANSTASSPAVTLDTYHVHGVVIDSHTGKPISRALVQAFGDRIAAFSDSSGRFALDVRYTGTSANADAVRRSMLAQQNLFLGLSARKPGYLNFFTSGQVVQSIPLSALERDLVLKLTPAAAIEGHVAATGDDHPERVQVSLFTRRIMDGVGRWQQAFQTSTNSRGEYRFGDLQPGEYKLVTREWSDEPAQRQEYDKPVPRYAPVHFPAGSTGNSGPDLHLTAGETLQANFHLHSETFYPVHVGVALPGDKNPGVQARVLQDGALSGFSFRYNARDKLAEGLLPSGTFELILTANGQEPASAIVPVVVTGAPLELPPVTLLPSISIPVVVHQDFTGKADTHGFGIVAGNNNFPSVQVSLASDDTSFTGGSRLIPDKNDPTHLTVERVAPGTYTVTATAMRGYVASVTSGGTDLLQHSLVVSAGGGVQPIDVTLRDDGGTIQGTLDSSLLSPSDSSTSDSPPVGTVLAFILCISTQATTLRAQQSIAQPSGKFTLFNLPPGTYRIFASRQPFSQAEYRSEAWLRANGSKAATITVEASGTATANLTSLLDQEP